MRVRTSAVIAVSLLTSSVILAQGSVQNLSITNYRYVSELFYSETQSYVEYSADLVNTGPALESVTATLTSLNPVSFVPVVNQDFLFFSPVPANSTVVGTRTFTMLVDRTVPFDRQFKTLKWTFTIPRDPPPIANAGPNQQAYVGQLVHLDGSASSNPSGKGTLSFSWEITVRPKGSAATLNNPASVTPTFVPDVEGNYLITLTVDNGTDKAASSMQVTTTIPPPPIADAGQAQKVKVGDTVALNGSKSTSQIGNPLTYAWSLIQKPTGSSATLTGATTVFPTFVADKFGDYVAQLIVNDGLSSSAPAVVKISTEAVPPLANAGNKQIVDVNSTVQLNGSASTDPNGLPLTYQWSFVTVPASSAATLSNPTVVNPTFIADRPGDYLVQLIVNNGVFSSAPSTVMISTNTLLPPSANAGPNQTVLVGNTVQLSGSGQDPQKLPLTYQWAILNKPAGSSASLSSAVIANPTFVADKTGSYVVQLIVNNGFLSSQPATVVISTICSQPTANAGPNQNVVTGTTVTLDGSASGDACQDPLTYSWSFTTRPNGSAATLSNATSVSPTFVVDLPGTYVAQLIVDNGFSKSNPATVTITAAIPGTILLTPNLLTIGSNSNGTFTLTLSAPAGPNGVVVTLSSASPNVASVPAAVTVAAGSTTTTIPVTPGNTIGTSAILATAAGFTSGSAVVNVVAPAISLSLSASSVGLTQTINGTVTLNAPAPAGGVVIALTPAPGGIVDVQPVSVTIPAGGITSTFSVKGLGVGSATITGSATGYASGSANISVQVLGKIILPTNVAVGTNQSLPFPVTLSAAAPAGGVTVTLTSADASTITILPATVFIPAGALTPAAQPVVHGIKFGSSIITAAAPGFTGDSQIVQVLAAPPNASAGPDQTVQRNSTVQLNGSGTDPQGLPLTFLWSIVNKPAGSSANLSSNTIANPAFVADQAGDYIAQLIVNNGLLSSAPATVKITATQCAAPTAVAGPDQNTIAGATVKLDGSASSDVCHDPLTYSWSFTNRPIGSNATLSNPNTVSPTFFVDLPGTYVVQLIVNNGLDSKPAVVTINAVSPGTIVLSPNPLTISSNNTGTLTITLPSAAGAGGLVVHLSSTTPIVATVPANVLIPAGSTTLDVTVTPGSSLGSTAILATGGSFSPGGAVVNVVAPVITVALSSNSVGLTQTVTGTVSLSAPAPPGGVTVSLSAAPGGVVDVTPLSLTIAAGSTMSDPFAVKGLTLGTATITASAPVYSSGTAGITVLPFGKINLPANLKVGTNQTVPFAVTLSAPAPTGGVTVSLTSSDTATATITPSVFIAAGAMTPATQAQVTGVNFGAVTISASATGFTGSSEQVLVSSTLTFNPGTLTVSLKGTQDLMLELSTPAPAGGLVVNLSSDNTSVATVPASVTIPANAKSITVPVTGVALGSAIVHASSAASPADTSALIIVANFGQIILPQNAAVGLGQSLAFPVSLSTPAPVGGVTITLSSADPTKLTIAPTTLSIAAGDTTPTTQPQIQGLNLGAVNITATGPGFTPVTQAVQVIANLTFVPSTLTITGATTQNLTLNLSAPAPAGGLTINLSSENTSIATVPATVTIAANATSVTVPVTGVGFGTAVLHASAPPNVADTTATITVKSAGQIILPNLTSVPVGQSVSFPVSLPAPAPAGGVTVTLSSSDATKATVTPTTVTIAAGQTAPATQPTLSGVALGSTTIAASAPGYTNATLPIAVLPVGKISLPASVTVGTNQSSPFPITLSTPAPAGGITVALTSSDPTIATITPASVVIAAGATTPGTQPQVNGINFGTVTISASATGFTGDSQQVQVTANLSFGPGTLTVPLKGSQNLTLNLSAPAPAGGLVVTLSSDNTNVATVPATVTIPANAQTITVPVSGLTLGSAVIHATSAANASDASAIVIVSNFGVIQLPAGATVGLGQATAFPVTLSAPAPAGGVTVTLASADPTKVSISPATVTIAAGATSPAVQPQISGLNLGTTNITASAPGFGSATQPVQVIATVAFTPGTLTITGANTQNLTLTLSAPAPAGGLTVTLSSENPTVATVPATVTIPAGATSVTVPVTGVAEGFATIHASAPPNVAETTAGITIKSAGAIILPQVINVVVGQSAPISVTLPVPAPVGGVNVTLSSSDITKATVTASVHINAGQTTPAVQPQINGVSIGSVTISASAPGYTTATQTANVNAVLAFTPGSVTITGSTTQNLTLSVSAASPNALLVNLSSSNPGVASVPQTVTIPANTTSVQVPVTSISSGSATITASTGAANIGTASATITVLSGIILPANPTVVVGDQVVFPVSLVGPAPAGGVLITLTSSDPSKVTLSTPNVLILAGQTTSTYVKLIGVGVGSATITATAFGYSPATTTVQVTSGTITFLPGSITINGAVTQNLTLAISPIRAISTTLNLSSSDPTVATVPSTVVIPANASAVIVPVTGVANGSAVIHASGLNIADTVAAVTVAIP